MRAMNQFPPEDAITRARASSQAARRRSVSFPTVRGKPFGLKAEFRDGTTRNSALALVSSAPKQLPLLVFPHLLAALLDDASHKISRILTCQDSRSSRTSSQPSGEHERRIKYSFGPSKSTTEGRVKPSSAHVCRTNGVPASSGFLFEARSSGSHRIDFFVVLP